MGPSKQIKSLKSNGLISFQIVPLKKNPNALLSQTRKYQGPAVKGIKVTLVSAGSPLGGPGVDPFIKMNPAGFILVPYLFASWLIHFNGHLCINYPLGSRSQPAPPRSPSPRTQPLSFLRLTPNRKVLCFSPDHACLCCSWPHANPLHIYSFPTDLTCQMFWNILVGLEGGLRSCLSPVTWVPMGLAWAPTSQHPEAGASRQGAQRYPWLSPFRPLMRMA